MRTITVAEVTNLPRRIMDFLKALRDSSELSDEAYDEMLETMFIYQYFHISTDGMYPGRAIDFTKTFDKVWGIMKKFPNYSDMKWKVAREKYNWVWDMDIELEDRARIIPALPFYSDYVSVIFDPPNLEAVIHEVYPTNR